MRSDSINTRAYKDVMNATLIHLSESFKWEWTTAGDIGDLLVANGNITLNGGWPAQAASPRLTALRNRGLAESMEDGENRTWWRATKLG